MFTGVFCISTQRFLNLPALVEAIRVAREAGEDEGKGFLFDRGSRLRAVQAGKTMK